jgi:hypothetical protein
MVNVFIPCAFLPLWQHEKAYRSHRSCVRLKQNCRSVGYKQPVFSQRRSWGDGGKRCRIGSKTDLSQRHASGRLCHKPPLGARPRLFRFAPESGPRRTVLPSRPRAPKADHNPMHYTRPFRAGNGSARLISPQRCLPASTSCRRRVRSANKSERSETNPCRRRF